MSAAIAPPTAAKALDTGVGDYLADIPDTHAISILRRPAAAAIRQAHLAQAQSDKKHPNVREALHDATQASTHELRQTTAPTSSAYVIAL